VYRVDREAYLEALGGRECMERVHRIFYGKLLSHPWLKGFFEGKSRDFLESQQTDFFLSELCGVTGYFGRIPASAHTHLFITDEVFELRHVILKEALHTAKVPVELHERWLQFDMSFKSGMVKASIDECKGRYKTEPVISVPKPAHKSAVA
jgi:hemoglobin